VVWCIFFLVRPRVSTAPSADSLHLHAACVSVTVLSDLFVVVRCDHNYRLVTACLFWSHCINLNTHRSCVEAIASPGGQSPWSRY